MLRRNCLPWLPWRGILGSAVSDLPAWRCGLPCRRRGPRLLFAPAPFDQGIDAELPGPVPVRLLEVRRGRHQARALPGDEGGVDRLGRRGAARVARGFIET